MPSETGHNQGQTNNQIMLVSNYGVGQPGSITVGGGGGVPEPFFRDLLDARRSMYRRTPEAQFPDGYLGTVVSSRKNDKMFNALKNRVNQRSYQRGVHKGERIDPADYWWPEEFDPTTRGLEATVTGRRQVPLGVQVVIPTSEALLPASGMRLQYTMNPRRQEQLRHLAPTWRW